MAADQVRRANVLEPGIRQGRRLQIAPEAVVNAAGIEPRAGIGFAACDYLLITKQRETRLPVEKPLIVADRDSGVVQMCCKYAHCDDSPRLIRLHVANHFVIAIRFAVEYEPLLHELQLMYQEHQEDTDEQSDKR